MKDISFLLLKGVNGRKVLLQIMKSSSKAYCTDILDANISLAITSLTVLNLLSLAVLHLLNTTLSKNRRHRAQTG